MMLFRDLGHVRKETYATLAPRKTRVLVHLRPSLCMEVFEPSSSIPDDL